MVRAIADADCSAVTRIYNHYIVHTVVTFEEQAVESKDMLARVHGVLSEGLPWLVAEQDGQVVGYAYARKWNTRSAYRFSVESTVYLDPSRVGRGVGSALYGELFRILRDRDIHAVIGGIALPNEASVALHEKFGMAKVAHFGEVGFKFGRWIDVGYWQRIFSP